MKPNYFFQPVVDVLNRKCFCFMDATGKKLTLAGKTDFHSRDHFAQCFRMHKDETLEFTDFESEIPFDWYDVEYKKAIQGKKIAFSIGKNHKNGF